MNKITEYLKETKVEFSHVSWPSKKQAIAYTVVVVVLSLSTAIFLGVFDFIFSLGLKQLILGS